MRVIKDIPVELEYFRNSLQFLTRSGKDDEVTGKLKYIVDKDPDNSLEKYSHFFQNIFYFEMQLRFKSTLDEVLELFSGSIRRVITVKEANIFYFDDQYLNLIPLYSKAPVHSIQFINNAYKNGILDWIFEKEKHHIIPDILTNYTDQRLNAVIIPITESGKKKGVFYFLTSIKNLPDNKLEQQFIQLLLGIVIQKIDVIRKKEELNSVYKELQTYQSKLSNDYKLSAIGELTTGVVEDILSPLQVIMTQADLINQDPVSADENISEIISSQVKKIESVIGRLVKFASINYDVSKIQPCNLNTLIKEFYEIISTSLQNEKCEFILDLEDDLPTILSHPNYINQLFTNIYQILKVNSKNGSGILIQTKYYDKSIFVRIIFTEQLKNLSAKNWQDDPTLRVLNHLMKKHEGEIKINSKGSEGSSIVLRFPLNRKIRQ